MLWLTHDNFLHPTSRSRLETCKSNQILPQICNHYFLASMLCERSQNSNYSPFTMMKFPLQSEFEYQISLCSNLKFYNPSSLLLLLYQQDTIESTRFNVRVERLWRIIISTSIAMSKNLRVRSKVGSLVRRVSKCWGCFAKFQVGVVCELNNLWRRQFH